MSPRPSHALTALSLGALLTFHLANLVVRADFSRPVPFSGRASWSMFAGPLSGHCTHQLRVTAPDGVDTDAPLARAPEPAATVLRSRTPEHFARVAPWLLAYADSDAALAARLDALITRWWRVQPEHRTHTLTDTLRCETALARPFARTLVLTPVP
ncbi:MAG: hypothetical protein JNK72_26655 [Myxococcales bacterium]|nr:hypothetical protein [Myxococcales bacterium]